MIINKIKKHKAIVFPILDALINGINLFSHIFISWFVTSNNYGILSALLSFSAILMVVGVALQTFIAKRISDPKWKGHRLGEIRKLSRKMIISITMLLLLLTPVLKVVLRSNTILIIMVITIFYVNSTLSIYRGVIQGEKKFLMLNRSFYIEATVRVIFTMILFSIFNQIIMALISILLGMILALIVDRNLVKKLYQNYEASEELLAQNINTKDLKIIFSANFFFYYFTSISVIVVNYYLPDLSGVFAVSVKYSQVFVHIGCSIITVIIPLISKYKYSFVDFRLKVRNYLLICIGLGVIGLFFYKYVLPQTVVLIFGEAYSEASKIVFIQGCGYFIFIISYFLVSMDIVIEHDGFIKHMAYMGVLMTLGLMAMHNSLMQVIIIEISSFSVLTIVLSINFIRRRQYEN